MKVVRRYDQYRRDLSIDMICEGCDAEDTYKGAYDDTNFWVNVVPGFECRHCHESSLSLGRHDTIDTHTKYSEGEQV